MGHTKHRVLGYLLSLVLVPFATSAFAAESEIEEVIVTGSYLKRTTADSPSPLSVITRADIENLGAVEIKDIIDKLSYQSGNMGTSNVYSGDDSANGIVNINLRNLGYGSTLVLIDGKRSVNANYDEGGNGFVNLSGIMPNIALERVEIIKDGASALYGSDAVAGVVNFITRQDFDGFEMSFDFATDDETKKQDDKLISAIMGITGDRGNITVSASYLDRDPLSPGDRYDRFGQTGISTIGNPGRYFATGLLTDATTLLPVLNAAGDPTSTLPGGNADLECAVATEAPGNAGVLGPVLGNGFCIYDFTTFFPLVAEQEVAKVYLNANFALSDTIEIYGSAGFSDNNYKRRNSLFPDVSLTLIPANNPGLVNDATRRGIVPLPFLNLTRMLAGHDKTPFNKRPVNTDSNFNVENFRFNLGTRVDFMLGDNSWTMDASVTRNRSLNSSVTRSDQLTLQTDLAFNGFGGEGCDTINGQQGSGNLAAAGLPFTDNGLCFWYNPFGSSDFKPDGSPQDDPLLLNDVAMLNWMVGDIALQSEIENTVIDLVFAGEWGATPSGPIGVAVGLQYRRDTSENDYDKDSNNNNYKFVFGISDWTGELTSTAAFVEVGIPVTDTLEINVAGRYEDFDEIGEDTVDPKLSIMWTPLPDLTLRGSVGTSYRTGSVLQLFGKTTSLLNSSDAFGTVATGGLAFRPTLADGNDNLEPESATMFNVGFSWAPTDGPLEGFSIDVDYYDFEYEDIITKDGHQDLINKENASRCPGGTNIDPTAGPLCGIQPTGGFATIGPGLPDQVIRDSG
ncbi:MAG: TonB-dependent receptor, partial [Dehalococcoidia bacterium]